MDELDRVRQRSAPHVHLRVQTGGASERVDLGDRLLGFTFEDTDGATDKASLQLDNWDLSFFDSTLVVKGAILDVSWGYPDRMAPERSLIVQRVKGFAVLQVEAHARSVLLHRAQTCRAFEQMTRSQVARQIAREHGFDDAFVHIEDTTEVYGCINQAGETDARLLARLARREGFRFYVDQTGLHWHSRRFGDPPVRVYRYYTDPGQGDVLGIDIDNDVLAKTGRTAVRGRDPRRRQTIEAAGSDAETVRDSLGDVREVVDPETGTTTLDARNGAASVRPSAASTPGRAKREADARFRTSSRQTVKLRLQAVGDPAQTAKSIIEVQGITALLSGKYYVKRAKHILGTSGYLMELDCIKDGTGRIARRVQGTKESAGRPNQAQARDPGELAAIEVVDRETGETQLEYRRPHG